MNQQFTPEGVKPIYKWRNHINKALKSCSMTSSYADISGQVARGELLFAEHGDAFVIAELTTVGTTNQIHIHIMGGKKEDMVEIEKAMCMYARRIGAKKITAITRKGFAAKNSWWRKNTSGWVNPSDFIEKEV